MPDDATNGGGQSGGLNQQLKSLFSTTVGKIAAGLVGAVSATAIAILSPLQDVIRNKFWPEDISIGQPPIQVTEGEPAPLQVLLTNNSSVAGISGGVVTVTSPNEAIKLTSQGTFVFGESKGSVYLKPEGLTLESQTFGKQRLLVHLKTNRGRTFDGEITVQAAPRKVVASTRNLSGGYRVILNGVVGQMQLKEFARDELSFSGMSEFENGEKLQFSGWRDGTTFFAKFTNGKEPAYKVEGIYCRRAHDEAKWIVINAKVVKYVGGQAAAPAKPQGTIKEKCEGYPDALADIEGDGVFWASVASN